MSAAEILQQIFGPLLGNSKLQREPQRFFAVGSPTPRWFIPAGRLRSGTVLAGWNPYRFTSRLKWAAIRAASQAGVVWALPGAVTVTIAGLQEIEWRGMGWEATTAPLPFVYLGTAGPRRKAVVHLVDRTSGECRVVVKLPLSAAAKLAIVHEADTLQQLSIEHRRCAPTLCFVDRERGIATQSVVPASPGKRKFEPEYRRLLHTLMLPGESISIAAKVDQIRCQFSGLTLGQDEQSTADEAISRLQSASPLPAFWIHGDFAPWNIRQPPQGSAFLLDWEDADRTGLPLQDALHFLHIQDYLFRRAPRLHFADLGTSEAAPALSRKECVELETVYLLRCFLQKKGECDADHAKFLLAALRNAISLSRSEVRTTSASICRQ